MTATTKSTLRFLAAALLSSVVSQAGAATLGGGGQTTGGTTGGQTTGGTTTGGTTTTTTTTPPPPLPSTVKLKSLYGTINPFYRDISAFWGNINPFYGNIGAFWGTINPFYGNIGAFWGNITPFSGDLASFYGNINPFTGDIVAHYGNIGAFWGNINPFWGDINAFWGNIVAFDAGKLTQLGVKVDDFVARSEAFWGFAVTAKTGLSFRDGFAKPMFAKYGMDLSNPATFYGKTSSQRAEFMLAWYDQLMEFAGMDHVDHWMKTINWTPAITQQQGEGYDATIGLIDFTVAGDADVQSHLSYFSGVSTFTNGHGAGVASLMVAAHDGKGIMGIAPHANVVAYNPFDATGTTSFTDIRNGILALSGQHAGVINMSLGVPGWTLHPDWKSVFSDAAVAASTTKSIFVMAAGNDGKAQTTNIAWNWPTDPNLMIVGSVGPDGTISSFSNTPGTACLLDTANKCQTANKLMNRFLVAPGELILVSDDHGGVIRQSGTSLAAPLVSGTIALLQDRWPWLVDYPDAAMNIIFKSAKDLGAPGVDAVYGWGLLDVTAAQSIHDFNALVFYEYSDLVTPTGVTIIKTQSAATVRKNGLKSTWEAAGAYFVVFEPESGTKRDFAIPLSTRLYGTVKYGNVFQKFVYDRMVKWMQTGVGNPCPTGSCFGGNAHLALSDGAVTLPTIDGLAVSYGFSSHQDALFGDTTGEYTLRLAAEDGSFGINLGYGAGAATLGYQGAFALSGDYVDGGVNPLLGFASGGVYGSADFRLGSGFSLSAGVSTSGTPLGDDVYGQNADIALATLNGAYGAEAATLSVSYQASKSLGVRVAYTQVAEHNGLLGVVSLQDDFAGATVTGGFTLSADLNLGDGYSAGLSATLGSTRSSGNDLAVVEPVTSSAFAFALAKTGVFGAHDRARLTFGQPLHVEAGTLSYTQIGVVDRMTGALGPITQSFDIGGQTRRYEAEFLYATPFLDGSGEFGAFAKTTLADDGTGATIEDYTGGISLRLAF